MGQTVSIAGHEIVRLSNLSADSGSGELEKFSSTVYYCGGGLYSYDPHCDRQNLDFFVGFILVVTLTLVPLVACWGWAGPCMEYRQTSTHEGKSDVSAV